MSDCYPIFIIGAPRSGTSITTWAIGQHPNIQSMPETAWIAEHAVGAYLSWQKGSERKSFSHLSNVNWPLEAFMKRMGDAVHAIVHDVYEERCRLFYGDDYKKTGVMLNNEKERAELGLGPPGLEIRNAVDEPKQLWVDGTPANSLFIWGLNLLFPNARFIHNLRKPEFVVRSLIHFDRAGGEKRELSAALLEWLVFTENALHAQIAFGNDKVFLLDYDRIQNDTKQMMSDLYQFLGEEDSDLAMSVFDKKINSSEVGAEESCSELLTLPQFVEAQEIYDRALNGETDFSSNEALEKLRLQFVDHTREFVDHARVKPR